MREGNLDVVVEKVFAYPDGRMDVKNAAKYLGLEEKTLAIKRSHGTGPDFCRMGKIFYFKDDLDSWIAEHSGMKSTAQARLKVK